MDLLELIKSEAWDDVESVEQCINKGIPIDDNWLDYLALNVALECKKTLIAKLLLEKNCRVNMLTETKTPADTPLHHAVRLGNLELVLCLLKKGASPVYVNLDGNTPLHLAFTYRRREIIKRLLVSIKEISDHTNYKNKEGLTHFHIVCTTGYELIIRKFLNNEIDVEDSISTSSCIWAGYTALHFAVTFKSFVAVKILLENGAHPRSKDAKGKTPLELAGELVDVPNHFLEPRTHNLKNRQLILDLLFKFANEARHKDDNCKKMRYVHDAIIRNDLNVVKLYLRYSWNFDERVTCQTQSFQGFSHLHFSVMYQKYQIAAYLISQGACVNVNDEGKYGTPLDLAIDFVDAPLISILLKNGAKTDNTNILHMVIDKLLETSSALSDIQLGYIADLVEEMECHVNFMNEFGSSVLHRVCNSIDRIGEFLLRVLLHHGADINMKDSKGQTAFQCCLERRYEKPSDYLNLFHHVKKLKAIGFAVAPENEKCCEVLKNNRFPNALEFSDAEIAAYNKKLLEEIEKMKKVKLTDGKYLHDFIFMSLSDAAAFSENTVLKNSVVGYDFGYYGGIISVQYRKALQYKNANDCKTAVKRSAGNTAGSGPFQTKRRCTK